MHRMLCRTAILSLAVLACLAVEAQAGNHARCRGGACIEREAGNPDLFASYYAPATCGGVPAQMYVSPLPTPEVVGHTYITYQPFMPHELMYPHHRFYYRYYNGGRGLTRTHVSWHNVPVFSEAGSLIHHFRIAR